MKKENANMEKSNMLIQGGDRKGNKIKISVEGTEEKQLSHFGGLDLHVSAVKTLIQNTNGMNFAEQDGDYMIQDKVTALYLNEIGYFIRKLSIHPEMIEEISNLDLVKNFIETIAENQEVMELVKQDNLLMKKEAEEEEAEEWI
jgi:hypothetical protein